MKDKKYNYFNEFVKQSEYSIQEADILKSSLDKFSRGDIGNNIKIMHQIEHTADMSVHNMLNYLLKDFLPPIEREDIVSLCNTIDCVTDSIEDVLIHIDIFNVRTIRPDVKQFTALLITCCKVANKILSELDHYKKSSTLKKDLIELNRLEEEGDALYENAVRRLYIDSKDPIELMVWTEIYKNFEKCFDHCEDIANVVETVILKNS